jgi:hypothetical protein
MYTFIAMVIDFVQEVLLALDMVAVFFFFFLYLTHDQVANSIVINH